MAFRAITFAFSIRFLRRLHGVFTHHHHTALPPLPAAVVIGWIATLAWSAIAEPNASNARQFESGVAQRLSLGVIAKRAYGL
ncbi:hypothetical protein HED48_18355 [Ochrobactrum intermedium]|nr:hypothetical protein [Brucella intermedia]